ncbi:MAG: methyl-accepting chemotaxis protein [Hyphomicrobiales bacterium]
MNNTLSSFFRNRSIRSTVISSNLLLAGLAVIIAIISLSALNRLLDNAEKSNHLVGSLSKINSVSGELEKFLQTRNIRHIDESQKLLVEIQANSSANSQNHTQSQSAKLTPLLDTMIVDTKQLRAHFETQEKQNKQFQKTIYKLNSTFKTQKNRAEKKQKQLLSEQVEGVGIERAKQIALKNAYILQDRVDRFLEGLPRISDRLSAQQEKQAKTALKNVVNLIEALRQIIDVTDTATLYGEIDTKIGELKIGLTKLFEPGVGASVSIGDLDTVWQSLKAIKALTEKLTTKIDTYETVKQSIQSELVSIDDSVRKQTKIIQTISEAKNAYDLFRLVPNLNNQVVLNQKLSTIKKTAGKLTAQEGDKSVELLNTFASQIEALSVVATQRDATVTRLINDSLKASAQISNASISSTQSAIDINKTTTMLTAVMVILAILCALATTYIMTRAVGKPISKMTNIMTRLANGDINVVADFKKRPNEIGKMQDAIEVFHSNAIKRIELEKTTAEDVTREQTRQKQVDSLIAAFKEEAGLLLSSFNEQADAMYETATSMNSLSETAHQESSKAKDTSFESTSSIQTVATAAEELSISTKEITRQVQTTSVIVDEGATNAINTSNRISTLATSAQKIGDVVSLIQDIAEQTNLLALNATIEAARAGEQGRGFAVVASEVKSLASQTSRATSEIAQQISDIQAASDDAVDAIFSINETMVDVKEHTETIAESVTQQDAATQEISISAQRASIDARKISDNLSNVSETVHQTNDSASVILNASNQLAENATRLNDHVDAFLQKVAAA